VTRRPTAPALPAAIVVAVGVELGLRTLSLPRLVRWLGIGLDLTSGAVGDSVPAVLPGSMRRHLDAVEVVMRRWPFGDTCLRRCLVLGHRLRGLQPVLRIGVRRGPDGRLGAHAWLEIGGRTLDPGSVDFGVLAAMGEGAR
jgi:Transglutaminase-like superfamily